MFDDFTGWWPRAPKKVQGGIKSQTRKFGNQWWAARWLEAIETFGLHRRVARGRSYARKGQVIDLSLSPGRISANVQGSRDTPYQIEIWLDQLSTENQTLILKELHTQPVFAATLLNGEIPPDIESLFHRHQAPLFPTKSEGRKAVCSCPDTSNPCKHIAAIFYLVSVELERDPFLLLHLRGLSREKIVPARSSVSLFPYSSPPEPIPADPQQFWKSPRSPQIPVSTPTSTSAKAPILQRLGPFPFWRGESNFLETLERIYNAVRAGLT
jgi:uncharacterized Zn finger protein